MKIFVLLALVGMCASESCTWSNWSQCKSPKKCVPNTAHSYPDPHKPGPHDVDIGRVRMSKMMKMKAKQWDDLARCRAEGTCPELNFQQSEGRFDCVDGMADDNPCMNINQLSFLDFQDLSDGDSNVGNDIWGWTDPENGDEYAIMCMNCGTSFVRLTPNPEEPTVLAYLPTATGCTSWRDVKTVNDHAFIVSEASGHGLQVFDMTRLRDLDTFTVVEPDAATSSEFGNAHNIVANEETDFIYVVGATSGPCFGGLLIYDVSDPVNPVYVACNGDDGYVHDAQCVIYTGPDADYQGNEICFNFNENTLTIVDVTDKDNQIEIAREAYDGARYTHQGWVTDDQTVLLMNDEQDECCGGGSSNTKTYLWDIVDLDNIVLMNTYEHDITVIDHNLYILGDLVFESNYMGGLRVLSIDQANYDLAEVGYFDVYPASNSPSFAGSWSNYPYFPSGNIAVTSMDFGLFIVEPDYEAMRAAARNKHYGTQTRTCENKSQTRQCYAPTC